MDAFEWNNNTGAFQVSVAVGQANVESAIFSVDSSVSFAYCLDRHHPRGRHKVRVFATALGLTIERAVSARAT
jgi:hypothetical protein